MTFQECNFLGCDFQNTTFGSAISKCFQFRNCNFSGADLDGLHTNAARSDIHNFEQVDRVRHCLKNKEITPRADSTAKSHRVLIASAMQPNHEYGDRTKQSAKPN